MSFSLPPFLAPLILTLKYDGISGIDTFDMQLGYVSKVGGIPRFIRIAPAFPDLHTITPSALKMFGSAFQTPKSILVDASGIVQFETHSIIAFPMVMTVATAWLALTGVGGEVFGGFNGVMRF
jgi:hypothetical protein